MLAPGVLMGCLAARQCLAAVSPRAKKNLCGSSLFSVCITVAHSILNPSSAGG
jgi:hypothetical protein